MQSRGGSCGLPLVSVSIIAYNHENFIRAAIESALNQNYQNIEIVVGDDCSTDSTWDIILELQSKHPTKIIAFRNQRNLGITGNSNEVLRRCKGKYIAFMGGDDLLLPDKIEKQVAVMEADESVVLCFHNVEVFDLVSNASKGNFYGVRASSPIYYNARDILQLVVSELNILAAMSVVVRRDAMPATGFESRVPVVSDWMMWIDVLANAEETAKVVFLPQVLTRYGQHDCNTTNNPNFADDDKYTVLAITLAKYPWLAPAVRKAMDKIVAMYKIKYLGRS